MTLARLNETALVEWAALPSAVRDEVRLWLEELPKVQPPIAQALSALADRLGTTYATARRRYDAWRAAVREGKPAWAGLVDGRAVTPKEKLAPEFVEWWRGLCESNQRKCRPAYRDFIRRWRSGEEIPGLPSGGRRIETPRGCTYSNLMKLYKPTKFEFAVMRQGLGAAAALGPQVLSTREGLWVGSHLMFDDLWHDNFTLYRGRPVRVLEFDALDVFSGCKFAWGTQPRVQREDGTMTGLKESQMRLLLAYVFTRHGYSARGTTLLTEHGTAAIREALARLLHDRTGGLIRVRESGITGREQAIAGMLPGRGNGNFRFKAGLESLRNLIHNELGALPAQTGKDVEHRPERLHGELQYCTDLARAIARRPKHVQERLAELVRYPVLEYHTQFLPALALVYGLINERTEHALEGWHACGHVAVDYRLSPAHDVWLGPAEYLALPAPSRALLAQLAQAEPETYCRQRLLSPQEVFNAGSRHLQPLAPSIVAEMLGPDLAREATVRGGYFEVAEAEAHPEPMRFEARVADDQGREAELREGEKYSVLVNPFDLSALWVTDARGRFLGVAKRVVRVRRDDEEALREAYGRRNRRLADLLRPVRGRHTEVTREAMAREAHNARVLSGEPITQAELHTAEREARTAADDATDLLAGASGGAERPARQEHTTDAPEAADVWSEVLGEDTNYDRE